MLLVLRKLENEISFRMVLWLLQINLMRYFLSSGMECIALCLLSFNLFSIYYLMFNVQNLFFLFSLPEFAFFIFYFIFVVFRCIQWFPWYGEHFCYSSHILFYLFTSLHGDFVNIRVYCILWTIFSSDPKFQSIFPLFSFDSRSHWLFNLCCPVSGVQSNHICTKSYLL